MTPPTGFARPLCAAAELFFFFFGQVEGTKGAHQQGDEMEGSAPAPFFIIKLEEKEEEDTRTQHTQLTLRTAQKGDEWHRSAVAYFCCIQ